MKTLHTIKMVCKEDGTEITYKNVETADWAYGGRVTLFLADGNTATFSTDNWDLWDLTPQRGWNYNI